MSEKKKFLLKDCVRKAGRLKEPPPPPNGLQDEEA
jgi:hypothetical protein